MLLLVAGEGGTIVDKVRSRAVRHQLQAQLCESFMFAPIHHCTFHKDKSRTERVCDDSIAYRSLRVHHDLATLRTGSKRCPQIRAVENSIDMWD